MKQYDYMYKVVCCIAAQEGEIMGGKGKSQRLSMIRSTDMVRITKSEHLLEQTPGLQIGVNLSLGFIICMMKTVLTPNL